MDRWSIVLKDSLKSQKSPKSNIKDIRYDIWALNVNMEKLEIVLFLLLIV